MHIVLPDRYFPVNTCFSKAGNRPDSRRNKVDLPEPDAPTKTIVSLETERRLISFDIGLSLL